MTTASKPGTKRAATSTWLLLVLTVCSGLCGLCMFIAGSVVVAEYNVYLDFVTGSHIGSAVCIIVIGLITITVSIIGFYASLKCHYCLMVTFLTLMSTILFIEVIASVSTFSLNADASRDASMKTSLQQSLALYGDPGSHATKAWDLLQTELHCCGLNAVDDYKDHAYFRNSSRLGSLPASCCQGLQVDDMGKVKERCRKSSALRHRPGCASAFRSTLRNNLSVVAAVGMLVALVQLVLIIAAGFLVKHWKAPGACYPCY